MVSYVVFIFIHSVHVSASAPAEPGVPADAAAEQDRLRGGCAAAALPAGFGAAAAGTAALGPVVCAGARRSGSRGRQSPAPCQAGFGAAGPRLEPNSCLPLSPRVLLAGVTQRSCGRVQYPHTACLAFCTNQTGFSSSV